MVAVQQLLLKFLEGLGCSDVIDATVLEYACGVLQSLIEEDGVEDEESLAHLDALLAGACGAPYEIHSETMRQERLATIVQEEHRARPAALGPEPAAPVPQGPGPSSSQQRAANFSLSSSRWPAVTSENITPVGDVPGQSPVSAIVQELRTLCSEAVSEPFLQYALELKFQMNVEALAAWLLDSDVGELQNAEEFWKEQRQRQLQNEEAARLLKEKNKQHILQKFDLCPVMQPKEPKKASKGGTSLEVWAGKQEQQPKVRYLDGRVVSTKGEKFIIEKEGDEWDGGSRGKVYTKGKRGKGFV